MKPYPLHLIVSGIIDLHARADCLHHNIHTHHDKNPALGKLASDICDITYRLSDILESRITPTLTQPPDAAREPTE